MWTASQAPGSTVHRWPFLLIYHFNSLDTLISLMFFPSPTGNHLESDPETFNVALLLNCYSEQQNWRESYRDSLHLTYFNYRYARDYIVEGEPYAGYDRHNAEVAAFHLDRYGIIALAGFIVFGKYREKKEFFEEYTSDVSYL